MQKLNSRCFFKKEITIHEFAYIFDALCRTLRMKICDVFKLSGKCDVISVVIPNYNNGKYLSECIESVLSQSYANKEIIIIDDCSTDNSREIITRYAVVKENNIQPIFNKKNLGISGNRHKGIKAARGKYITTLDSDDMFDSSFKLEKEYELIKKFESQGEDVIAFSNIRLVFNDGTEKVVGNESNICEGMIFDKMLVRKCFIPRDFLMKKALYLNTGGYDPTFEIYEDWDLKLRLSAKYEFYYTGLPGIVYRRHGEGLSSAEASKHISYLRKAFIQNLPNLHHKQLKVLAEKEFAEYLERMFKKNG